MSMPGAAYTGERKNRSLKNDNFVELVQALADGKSVIEAADVIGIKPATCITYVNMLRARHRVRNIPQLVAHYLRNGWID